MDDSPQDRFEIARYVAELPSRPTRQADSADPDDDWEAWQEFDPKSDIDEDDRRWDVFQLDDAEDDPQPAYGDFWPQDEGVMSEHGGCS